MLVASAPRGGGVVVSEDAERTDRVMTTEVRKAVLPCFFEKKPELGRAGSLLNKREVRPGSADQRSAERAIGAFLCNRKFTSTARSAAGSGRIIQRPGYFGIS